MRFSTLFYCYLLVSIRVSKPSISLQLFFSLYHQTIRVKVNIARNATKLPPNINGAAIS